MPNKAFGAVVDGSEFAVIRRLVDHSPKMLAALDDAAAYMRKLANDIYSLDYPVWDDVALELTRKANAIDVITDLALTGY